MITDERLKEIAIDIPDSMTLADAKKLFDGLVKHLTIGELVEMATELLSIRSQKTRLIASSKQLAQCLREWDPGGNSVDNTYLGIHDKLLKDLE